MVNWINSHFRFQWINYEMIWKGIMILTSTICQRMNSKIYTIFSTKVCQCHMIVIFFSFSIRRPIVSMDSFTFGNLLMTSQKIWWISIILQLEINKRRKCYSQNSKCFNLTLLFELVKCFLDFFFTADRWTFTYNLQWLYVVRLWRGDLFEN